jgi:hypothetical protein
MTLFYLADQSELFFFRILKDAEQKEAYSTRCSIDHVQCTMLAVFVRLLS